jgi:hypothetical protein
MTTDHLLEAVDQLSNETLDEFARQVTRLAATRKCPSLSSHETELLREINKEPDPVRVRRYQKLGTGSKQRMTAQEINVSLPEHLYLRLQHAAQATQRPLADVLIHAVEVGSPPNWEDTPAEFHVELAALDRLDDETLWQIARERRSEADMVRWQELLDKQADSSLSQDEQMEMAQMRTDTDRLTLRKAHAVALLRWRGHSIPPAEMLE